MSHYRNHEQRLIMSAKFTNGIRQMEWIRTNPISSLFLCILNGWQRQYNQLGQVTLPSFQGWYHSHEDYCNTFLCNEIIGWMKMFTNTVYVWESLREANLLTYNFAHRRCTECTGQPGTFLLISPLNFMSVHSHARTNDWMNWLCRLHAHRQLLSRV